jgi:hypothetical protein
VFTFYSRILVAPFLILLPLISLFKKRISVRDIIYILLGFVVGVVLILIIGLDILGPIKAIIWKLNDTWKILCLIKDYLHSAGYLIYRYTKDFVLLSSVFLTLVLVYFFDRKLLSYQRKIYWVWGLYLLSLLVFVEYKLLQGKPFVWFFVVSPIILFFTLIDNILEQNKYREEFIATLIFLYFGIFVGSNVGLIKIYTSGAGVLIFSIGFNSNWFNDKRKFKILMSFMFVIALIFNLQYVHRDYSYWKQDKYFTKGSLKGMKTYHTRYNELNDFIDKLRDINDMENDYVVVNKAFIVEVMLNKTPQNVCYVIDPIKFERALNKPKYVILCTRKIGEIDWVHTKLFTFNLQRDYVLKNTEIIHQYYKEVRRSPNGVFILYKIKEN